MNLTYMFFNIAFEFSNLECKLCFGYISKRAVIYQHEHQKMTIYLITHLGHSLAQPFLCFADEGAQFPHKPKCKMPVWAFEAANPGPIPVLGLW